MTKELRMIVEVILAELKKKPKSVLEIGSRSAVNQEDISNLRPLLPNAKYIGVDMQSGTNVDVVADATKLPFKNHSFELVLCLETMEHAIDPVGIAKEIERVVKKNGAVIISSQQNFPIHMHPSDYFRYTPYGLATLLPGWFKQRLLIGLSPDFDDEPKKNPRHVVVVGWGGSNWNKKTLKRVIRRSMAKISGHKPYRHRLQELVRILRRAFGELKFRFGINFFE